MTRMTEHEHGAFSWADLATPDPDAAKRFYGELLGAGSVDEGMGPEGTYTRLQRDGRAVAGLYRMLPEQQGHGVPAYWMPYVTVDDVDAVARRVPELGGTLLLKPLDAHDKGRMAVVVDPSGAHLGLWTARSSCGAQVMKEPGSLTWAELLSRDVEAAKAFLCGLLGWRAQVVDMGGTNYTLLANAKEPVVGAMQVAAEWGPVPSHWVVYFGVHDCDEGAERVRRLGGKVHVPPTDIPEVGRFAMCADPQGAVFAILQDAPRG